MMTRSIGLILTLALGVAIVGCSGESDGDNGGNGDAPPTSPTPTNRTPSITSINVSPGFGVVGLSQLTLGATATDPDNDALTFTWTVGSQTLNGPNQSIPMPGDGPQTARVTVTDGRGGTTTDQRTFASGTMTGTWIVNHAKCGPTDAAAMTAVQTGGTWTATVVQTVSQVSPCSAPAGTTGRTDSAPATITAAGAITVRLKFGNFPDVIFTGTMDATGPTAGRRITGISNSVTSGFFDDDPFTMTKQ
jgi:hypothetical protein